MGRKLVFGYILLLGLSHSLKAQETGFQYPAKFGLGMSRNFLIDAGLVSFSYIPRANSARYYDALLGVAVLIGKHTMLMPKLELNAGLLPLGSDELFVVNVGVEGGLLTDFKQSGFVVSPKVGLSIGQGLFRLHYLRNFLSGNPILPGFGGNSVVLEINIASLQGKKIKVIQSRKRDLYRPRFVYFIFRLEFCVLGCPREGNHIADIAHAGYEQYHAFEAETEACMRRAAEAAAVEVPIHFIFRDMHLLHALQELIHALFTLGTANDLADARGQDIHSSQRFCHRRSGACRRT